MLNSFIKSDRKMGQAQHMIDIFFFRVISSQAFKTKNADLRPKDVSSFIEGVTSQARRASTQSRSLRASLVTHFAFAKRDDRPPYGGRLPLGVACI